MGQSTSVCSQFPVLEAALSAALFILFQWMFGIAKGDERRSDLGRLAMVFLLVGVGCTEGFIMHISFQPATLLGNLTQLNDIPPSATNG